MLCSNPFVYDDYVSVVENPSIQPPLYLRSVLLYQLTRPVVNASYAVDRAIWGPEPFGYHLTSVLLHMLNVGLLFLLVWRLSEDWQRTTGEPAHAQATAFATALLFAVHPMMTEAVGYISGRSEVLCATFFLLGMLCARRWMLRRRRALVAAFDRRVGRRAGDERNRRHVSVRAAVLRPPGAEWDGGREKAPTAWNAHADAGHCDSRRYRAPGGARAG